MRKFHGTLRKFGAICLAAALLFSAIGTLNFATYAASWSTPDEMTQTNKLITVKYSGGVKTDDEGFVWENGDIAICTQRHVSAPPNGATYKIDKSLGTKYVDGTYGDIDTVRAFLCFYYTEKMRAALSTNLDVYEISFAATYAIRNAFRTSSGGRKVGDDAKSKLILTAVQDIEDAVTADADKMKDKVIIEDGVAMAKISTMSDGIQWGRLALYTSKTNPTSHQRLAAFSLRKDIFPHDKGGIEIYKKDANGKALSGAEFAVFNSVGTKIADLGPTDASGYCCSSNDKFDFGTYTVKETTFPTGYTAKDGVDEWTVKVDKSFAHVTLNAENVEKTGSVQVTKSSEDGLIKGLKFNLKGTSTLGTAYDQTVETDASGIALFENVPCGLAYTLAEVDTPDRYEVPASQNVVVEWNKTTQCTISNELAKFVLEIKKIDEENSKPITASNAKFQVKNLTTGELVSYTDPTGASVTEFETANGILDIPVSLPYGSYQVIETQAPAKYLKNANPITFTVSAATSYEMRGTARYYTVTVTNAPLKGYVSLEKTGLQLEGFVTSDSEYGTVYTPKYAQHRLAGVDFEIYAAEDIKDGAGAVRAAKGTKVGSMTTTATDAAKSDLLYPGKYELKEVKTLAGYKLAAEPIKFTVQETGAAAVQLIPISLANDRTTVKISAVKEKEVWSATTSGDVVSRELVKVPAEGCVFGLYTNEEFLSYDGLNKAPKDSLVAVAATNSSGVVTFEGMIPFGSYYVKELKAPDAGYIIDDTHHVLDVTTTKTDGKQLVIDVPGKILNIFQKHPVTITKTDLVSSAPVPGAVVEILAADTKTLLYRLITADDGTLPGIILEPGKYVFKETVAPTGYALNTNSFNFTVNNDGTVTGVTEFTDEPTKVVITKTDAETGTPLRNATIAIYDAAGTEVFRGKTDKHGEISTMYLPAGATYTFKELTAPSGYALNSTVYKFKISATGSVTGDTSLANAPTKVELQKVDSKTGKPVEGATIEVYNAAGTRIAWDVTDANGKIYLDRLPAGATYTFKEVKAPNKYALNTQTYSFTIAMDGTVTGTTQIKNEPTKVVLKKVDAATGKPVKGAMLAVYRDHVLMNSYETDANGEVVLEYLEIGVQYSFKETAAPSGYALSSEEKTFWLDETGAQINGEIELKNTPTSIVITKTDAKTGEPLAGVTVAVYDQNGTEIFQATTNAKGQITKQYLEAGKIYKYKEIATLPQYVLDETEHEFMISADGTVTGNMTFTNEPTRVTVLKIDSETGLPLKGATIAIYDKNGNEVAKDVTDENGQISALYLNVNEEYSFKEIAAPAGYCLDSTKHTFTIDKYGKATGELTMKDAQTQVVIVKTDAKTGEPVSGSFVEIYDGKTKVAEGTTDGNGKITIKKLTAGKKYTFKEVKAPKGYVLNPNTYTFQIAADGKVTGTVAFVNTPTKAVLKKIDAETGAPVVGATLEISKDGQKLATGVTDEKGEVTVEYLEVGVQYSFKEIAAPDGYALSSEEKLFWLDETGAVVNGEVQLKNTPTRIVIKKTDSATNEPIEGVTIAVYDETGAEVFRAVTDENGEISKKYLKANMTYTYKELETPSKYALDDTVHTFTISTDGTVSGEVSFTNDPTHVTIKKVDSSTLEPVPGAELVIYDADGQEVYRGITDEDGQISVDYLPSGAEYTVEEVAAPDGYICSKEVISFKINIDGTIEGTCEMKNTPVRVVIKKTDMEGNPVAGAELTIKDAAGETVAVLLTDENGEVDTSYLLIGEKYTVQETKTPNGYAINNRVYEFEVDEEGLLIGDSQIKDDLTRITIKKVDEEGNVLEGAEFTLYDGEGKAIGTAVTDETGLCYFEGFEEGDYTIMETKAPSGFDLNHEAVHFTNDGHWDNEAEYAFVTVSDTKTVIVHGDGAHPVLWAVSGLLCLIGGASIILAGKRKKKSEN